YKLNSDQQICGNVLTGCVTPERVDNPKSFAVITGFTSEVAVDILDELSMAVGYANLTLQLGPDGQRRNILYSPDARVYLAVTAHLDELYKTVSGSRRTEGS